MIDKRLIKYDTHQLDVCYVRSPWYPQWRVCLMQRRLQVPARALSLPLTAHLLAAPGADASIQCGHEQEINDIARGCIVLQYVRVKLCGALDAPPTSASGLLFFPEKSVCFGEWPRSDGEVPAGSPPRSAPRRSAALQCRRSGGTPTPRASKQTSCLFICT